MNLRFIDWIWQVRGSVPLAAGVSSDEVYERLNPLFHQPGTTHERFENTLTFSKKDQAAQDRMSVFDGGVLRIETCANGPVLRYVLTSRILLFCFLAPLLFLAFAGATVAIGKYYKPKIETAAEKAKAEAAKKKLASLPMNPIDKALGAPAPEKPDKKDNKDKKDKKNNKDEDEKNKPSPNPGYVFSGIFATLYLVGRILEDRLVKWEFRKYLLDS